MKGCNQEDRLIEKINEECRELLILYTNGSNEKEISYFVTKLNGEPIYKDNHILVFNFK
jgi:hypothetical protein